MQCPPFARTWNSGVSPVCVTCTLLLPWLSRFAFSPVVCNGSLPVEGRVVSGPVRGCLGLKLSQTRHFSELQQAELQGTIAVWSLEKLSLVGGACSQTQCLPPNPLLGPQSNWCVWLFSPCPYPWAGVTLELWWPLSGMLAHCQAWGTALDRIWPRAYWRGQVFRRMWGQGA